MNSRAQLPVHVGGLAIAAILGLSASCIAYDGEIQQDPRLNDNPVRFVEPVLTTLETRCDCRADQENPPCPEDRPASTWNPGDCVQPNSSGIPHLMEPVDFPFCACGVGESDSDPPPVAGIELYVEDRDDDDIFSAVFIDLEAPGSPARLDLEPFLLDNYSDELVSSDSDENLTQPRQPDRAIRRLLVTDRSTALFDPCNHGSLEPGWHLLTILVTDRPWSGLRQNFGSPDFASGATVDTTHYTFFCEAPDVAPCDTRCQPVVDG